MQPHNPKPLYRRRLYVIGGVIVVGAAAIIAWRLHESATLSQETKDDAAPIVAVIAAKAGPQSEEVVLPGNVQAWHEAPIYARTSGYLKAWNTDIGTQVKEGDVLAEIDTPEIDAQLRQAEADLKTAQATASLAESTEKRWKALLAKDSVSKQEADEKLGDAQAKEAALASAQANRDHLKDLESFKHMTAPFDGTITARNTDNGALINTGSGTASGGVELFHIADTSKLRIYVQVPQTEAGSVTPDVKAELHFAEHPGKIYAATLLKTADAIDPVSRTLLTEFTIDNPNNMLLAGGYTEVHLQLPSTAKAVRLPVNTLIFRAKGLQIATLGDDSHVSLKTVVMGRDFGNDVEIISGVNAGAQVVVNPPDSLEDGEEVRLQKPKDKSDPDADDKSDDKKDSKKEDKK